MMYVVVYQTEEVRTTLVAVPAGTEYVFSREEPKAYVYAGTGARGVELFTSPGRAKAFFEIYRMLMLQARNDQIRPNGQYRIMGVEDMPYMAPWTVLRESGVEISPKDVVPEYV